MVNMKKKINKLSLLGKLLYYIGVLKFTKKESIFNDGELVNCIRIRFIHPIGFIYFVLLIICFGATKGFLNKEILEIKEHFVLL